MRPLAPAAFELGLAGQLHLAGGLALGAAAVSSGFTADHGRAAIGGLALALATAWLAWGRRAARRAIRLALPVGSRWALEPVRATTARVVVAQVAPLAGLAVVAAGLARPALPVAPAAAAGALAGVGVTALLLAGQVRRAERAGGRRLLRAPGPGPPLHRRALYLEPAPLGPRPPARVTAPWPAHRPPASPRRAAIVLEPANPPAHHARGVRYPRAAARRRAGVGDAAQGWRSR